MHLDALLSGVRVETFRCHVILKAVCSAGRISEAMEMICKQGGAEHDPSAVFTLGRHHRSQLLGTPKRCTTAFWVRTNNREEWPQNLCVYIDVCALSLS